MASGVGVADGLGVGLGEGVGEGVGVGVGFGVGVGSRFQGLAGSGSLGSQPRQRLLPEILGAEGLPKGPGSEEL